MIALLFPGQGTEPINIEKDDISDFFLQKTKQLIGIDIENTHFDSKDTTFAQLQTFVTSMIKFTRYVNKYSIDNACAAGLSFGEITALCVSEVFSFEEGLDIVVKRGKVMDKCCKKYKGGMLSILGLEDSIIESVCGKGIWPANYNCNGQLVLSGYLDKIAETKVKLHDLGVKKMIDLNVAGAFHSPLMKTAKIEFGEYMNKKNLNIPKYPVFQNVTSLSTKDCCTIKKNTIEQLVKPVLWKQSIINMKKEGVTEFIDFSENGLLTKFLKRI